MTIKSRYEKEKEFTAEAFNKMDIETAGEFDCGTIFISKMEEKEIREKYDKSSNIIKVLEDGDNYYDFSVVILP